MKTKRATSSGKCQLCQRDFSKQAMTRHLAKCLAEHAGAEANPAKTKSARLFHLVVQGGPDYWLHVEMPASTTLVRLDAFLRQIWLECCGHLSAFNIQGISYASQPDDYGWDEEVSMNVRLDRVLFPGATFSYQYDFGSTTQLSLKVVGERVGPSAKSQLVRLLARNNPPLVPCGGCGAPATRINSSEPWEPTSWVCNACAESQPEDEDYFLPVVNSPRAGVCGYTG